MRLAVIGMILLVFVATGSYLVVGDTESINTGEVQHTWQAGTVQPVKTSASGKYLPAVEDMLQGLERRLEREPEDARGWDLLGRSYEFLGRTQDAEAAFALAASLGYGGGVAARSGPVSVRVVVRLDPSLAGNLSGKETVFVFARAVSGPRVPLAVLRKPANDFPLEFELEDSMAITPEFRLSMFGEVIVGARISAGGEASASGGDLEGYSSVVNVNSSEEVVITIDQEALAQTANSAREG